MNDFLESFYGDGWKYIKQVLQIFDETTYDDHIQCFSHTQPFFKTFFPRIDEMYELFDKAEQMTSDEKQKMRIRRARLLPLYISICVNHDERKNMGREAAAKLLEDKKLYISEFKKADIKRCEWFGYDYENMNIDGIPVDW